MAKQPRTIIEQIRLLQSRNLKFNNIQKATDFLSNVSYYRLQGYWWEMQDDKTNHNFKNNSFFEQVIELYNFDRQFRLILFNAIERIEIALRTKLIYHLSLSFGAIWYNESKIFQNDLRHKAFCDKINLDLSTSIEEFIIKHFQNHPDELPESWKTLEILSFTTLSKLYSNLKHQLPEKNIIAKEFGFSNQKYLVSYLHTISLIRNIIAHHSRLWNRVIINKCSWDKTTTGKILNFVPNNQQQRKIFPILSTILYLLDKINTENQIKEDLIQLLNKHPNIEIKRMGFPSDWRIQPIWK